MSASVLSPLGLSHHHEGQHDRSIKVLGRFVCRRCFTIISALAGVAGLKAVGLLPGRGLATLLVAVLPVPAVLELVAEQRRRLRYSGLRVTILNALAGCSFGLFLEDLQAGRFDRVALIYVPLLAVAIWSVRRTSRVLHHTHR